MRRTTRQKALSLPIRLHVAWNAYQAQYPEIQFSPLVARLLREYLTRQSRKDQSQASA